MIHFELTFVRSVKSTPILLFWHVDVQFYLKRLSLHHCIVLFFNQRPLNYLHGSISGLSILLHWPICLLLNQYHTILIHADLNLFFVFNFYGPTHSRWKALSQGLNPSHSCNLCHISNPLSQAGGPTCTFTVPEPLQPYL